MSWESLTFRTRACTVLPAAVLKRPADDLPFAGLIGDPISDLDLHRIHTNRTKHLMPSLSDLRRDNDSDGQIPYRKRTHAISVTSVIRLGQGR